MATTDIPISTDAWTLVSSGPAEGSVSAKKPRQVFIVEAASLPSADSNEGHFLEKTLIYYNLDTGVNLYAKAYFENNIVVRTE